MSQENKNDVGVSESEKSYEYFEGHNCVLPKDKISAYEIKCSWFRNFVLRLIAVQMGDTRARKFYKSYAALCEEKYRQYRLYAYSIHPYSKLRLRNNGLNEISK